ncbi:MAG: DUF1905 domain-containing protein [Acidobacteria bacterium]|nr:DUF1905 domain-containing protein [Acidobacteriota bacterium]
MPSFLTVLHQTGNNVGIVVPDPIIAELGAGRRPVVKVTINGSYTFVSSVGAMGGRSMIGFSSAHRAASGLQGGDAVEIELRLETAPREVDMPAELTAALAADEIAAAAFKKLSFSARKEHARAISDATAPETRQRRLHKIIAGLRGE